LDEQKELKNEILRLKEENRRLQEENLTYEKTLNRLYAADKTISKLCQRPNLTLERARQVAKKYGFFLRVWSINGESEGREEASGDGCENGVIEVAVATKKQQGEGKKKEGEEDLFVVHQYDNRPQPFLDRPFTYFI